MNTMNDDLRSVLGYDPITGQFTWLPGTRNAGKSAGSLHKVLGYIEITHKSTRYYAHRLAWFMCYGSCPEFIDHINGNRADNRIDNLRSVVKQENHYNMKCYSTSRTQVTGVIFHKQSSKWRASITVDKKTIELGHFDDFVDAVMARKTAEQHHGYHPNHGRTT